jgi:acyl-coenzyme A thioesterase PaaI-like protein
MSDADEPLTGSGRGELLHRLNERVANGEATTGARADLARATRTIIDELMRSTATDEDFERASELVAAAVALLRGESHGRGYVGVAEGSLADGGAHFLDYSPFIGLLNPLAPPLTVHYASDNTVVAAGKYGAAYEGPPGCLHGGFIAAGFDEVLGFAQGYAGLQGMTGRLEISYRSPTPLFREVRYVARMERVEGRKIFTSATLSDGDRLCAEAQGLFISMKPEVFARLMGLRAQPEPPPPA